jgi:hypothetical protein
MDFCWDDYRGGIINASDELSKRERAGYFHKYLEKSAGLIFCVPADTIIEITNRKDVKGAEEHALSKYQDFINMNQQLIKNIPVTVAITKSDLLKDKQKNKDDVTKEDAKQFVKELLPALFGEDNGVTTLVVTITLGENLIGRQGERITGQINTDPRIGHIHLPIMFNLYFALKDYITEANKALETLESSLTNHKSVVSRALNHNWIQKAWYGEDIENLNSQTDELKRKILKEKEKLKLYQKDLETIRKEFTSDCEFYVNGQLQTTI